MIGRGRGGGGPPPTAALQMCKDLDEEKKKTRMVLTARLKSRRKEGFTSLPGVLRKSRGARPRMPNTAPN